MPLLYEILAPTSWQPVAVINQTDRIGSISDISQGVRDIILFRCYGDHSVIYRSVGGADFEVDGTTARGVLMIEGMEALAKLHNGESYEQAILSDHKLAYRARWTHVD
jgi:hypothetical protein